MIFLFLFLGVGTAAIILLAILSAFDTLTNNNTITLLRAVIGPMIIVGSVVIAFKELYSADDHDIKRDEQWKQTTS